MSKTWNSLPPASCTSYTYTHSYNILPLSTTTTPVFLCKFNNILHHFQLNYDGTGKQSVCKLLSILACRIMEVALLCIQHCLYPSSCTNTKPAIFISVAQQQHTAKVGRKKPAEGATEIDHLRPTCYRQYFLIWQGQWGVDMLVTNVPNIPMRDKLKKNSNAFRFFLCVLLSIPCILIKWFARPYENQGKVLKL